MISCYDDFMKSDDVYYVSEHRGSYGNCEELENIEFNGDILLVSYLYNEIFCNESGPKFTKKGIKVSVSSHRVY